MKPLNLGRDSRFAPRWMPWYAQRHIKFRLTRRGAMLLAEHFPDEALQLIRDGLTSESWIECYFPHFVQVFAPHMGIGLELPFDPELYMEMR